MIFKRYLTIALLACCSILSGAAPIDLEEAALLVQEGRIEQAIKKLTPLARGNGDARLMLGRICRTAGRYEEALALLDRKQAGEALLAADLLFQTGRLDRARDMLRPLATTPESLRLLGDIQQLTGRIKEAEKTWQSAIPFYERMSYEEAAKAPAERFVTFGRILVRLNRFQEANEVMLAQALEKDGDNLPALIFGGRIFSAKYDFPEGRKYFLRARKLAPRNPDVLAGLARVTLDNPMRGGGRLQEAITLLDQALRINPRHESALIARGDTFFFDGLYAEANGYYQRACDANPTSLEALGARYACAHLTFDAEGKTALEKKALQVSAKPAVFYLSAARHCELQCHYPLALAMGNKAYGADPTHWPLYTNLALGELRSGRYKRARTIALEGLEKDEYNLWLRNTTRLFRHFDRHYVTRDWGNLVFHVPSKTEAYYLNYLGPLLGQASRLFQERYGITAPAPIHVEVYPDGNYFSCRVLGLPDFPAQGVCFGRVIAVLGPTAYPGNFALAAWHEFAHVFTVTGTGYHIPRWLTEGISVREEGLCPVGGGQRSYVTALAKAIARDELPTLADFSGWFRRPRSAEILLTAYALAPLAVECMISDFGHAGLKKLLVSLKHQPFEKAFPAVTGLTTEAFTVRFHEKLMALGGKAAEQFVGLGMDTRTLRAELKEGEPDPRRMANLAWAYLKKDNPVDAETWALKLRNHPAYGAEAAAVLGHVYAGRREYKMAGEFFEKALKQQDRNAYGTLMALSKLAMRRKDRSKQAEYLVQAWRRFPDLAADRGDHGSLGRLCRYFAESKDERLEEALLDFVQRDRTSVWARSQLADIHKARGDHEGRLALLKELAYMRPFAKPGELNKPLFQALAECAESLGFAVEARRARKVLDLMK